MNITQRPAETSAAERALLRRVLSESSLTGCHLEIGTAAGGTLAELMSFYPATERPRFVVVDPMQYLSGQIGAIARNLAAAGIRMDEVDFRVKTSAGGFQESARDEKFSFIFIDAIH